MIPSAKEGVVTDDERMIRELVDAWMAASRRGDIEGVMAMMTQDVVFMTPGRPPFGRQEFAAGAESMKGVAMDGRSDIQEIEIFGDRAWIRNHIDMTLTRPGAGVQRFSGPILSILRKESDGRWRLARDANFVMEDA
jgi:uncharacterized protein (TIGR02246 family)